MKIAIIGGGISGLYLAWKLSERGEEVFVFEKKKKIGKEVCSGLFSDRILEKIPQAQKLIEHSINYSLIHFPKKTLRVKFRRKFFIIDHFMLDNLVFNLAKKSGAKFYFGKIIDALPLGFDRILGCDGANSQIRKILNLPPPKFYLGIKGISPKKDKSDFVETWPTKNGFLWKIPRGENTEWGIIEKPKVAKKVFETFIKNKNLEIENIRAAAIPEGFVIPKSEKITLCGDAAGLVKPWSGGGVIWGLTAADILLKTFPNFLEYRRKTKKIFLPQIIFSKIVKKLVYFLGFNFPFILARDFKIDGDFLMSR